MLISKYCHAIMKHSSNNTNISIVSLTKAMETKAMERNWKPMHFDYVDTHINMLVSLFIYIKCILFSFMIINDNRL